jgi:hypothetical protein
MGNVGLHATLLLERNTDVDDNELDELTGMLRRSLLSELDVDAEPLRSSDSLPQNSKSADVTSIGALAIALSPITLRSMFQLLQEWLKNRPVRTVKVKIGADSIELTHLTSADQRKLIDAFIERHSSN